MKKLDKLKMTRRQVLKAGLYGGVGMMLPWRFIPRKAFAAPLSCRAEFFIEVKWENRLVDAAGIPLPYLITGKDNGLDFRDFTGIPVHDLSLH